MEIDYTNENLMEPIMFHEKIDEVNGNIGLLLDEFKRIYILSKMHPTNQEYQQQYENMTNGINNVQTKLFSISNDVQKNIDTLNKSLFDLHDEINIERETNEELKKKIRIIENKSNAASEMIHDYTKIYDERYLRNWALGLSTLICIISIGTIFQKQGV
jgi:phosphoenolpyruvate-protein kinase (PTS system EI component)